MTLSFSAVRAVYREHRIILWLSAAYFVSGGLVLAWLERPWPIRLTSGLFRWWAVASLIWLLWEYLRHPRRARSILSGERILGALLVVALIGPLQITYQSLKQSVGHVVGFPWDPFLARLDVTLHGSHAWSLYARLLPNWSWVRAIDILYVAWFLVFLLFLFWASWSHLRLLRQRALLAFLLLTSAERHWERGQGRARDLATTRSACSSARGPYGQLLTDLDAFGTSGSELFARRTQRWLWGVHASDQTSNYAGVSAMPSFHVAMAVLFALVGWQRCRIIGALLIGYATAIQIGSVLLAWHYAVDGYLRRPARGVSWVSAKVILQRVEGAHTRNATLGTTRAVAVQGRLREAEASALRLIEKHALSRSWLREDGNDARRRIPVAPSVVKVRAAT